MLSLKQRRRVARTKRKKVTSKTFNMHWIVETIDQIITELSEYAGRDPEIDAAIEVALALKQLISAYSERTLNTAYRSTKDRDILDMQDWSQGVLNSMVVNLSNLKDTIDSQSNLVDKLETHADDWYHNGILSKDGADLVTGVGTQYDELVESVEEAVQLVSSERGVLGGMSADELMDALGGKSTRGFYRSRRGRARRRFFRK